MTVIMRMGRIIRWGICSIAFLCLLSVNMVAARAMEADFPLAYYRSISDYYHVGWCGLISNSHYYHADGHHGTDFSAPAYTPVKAILSGTVVANVNSNDENQGSGYGNYVKISHADGSSAIYAHMNATAVRIGMRVRQGDIIGYVGSTGSSTGNHLHLEYRNSDNKRRSVLNIYNSYTNKVSGDQVLRKSPASTSGALLTIPSGSEVKVKSYEIKAGATWLCVTYDGKTGYIQGTAVNATGPQKKTYSAAPLVKDDFPNSTNSTYKVGKYLVPSALKLRASWSSSSALLGTIPKGTEVIVSDVTGCWGKVSYDGLTGWINLDYTELQATGFFLRFHINGGSGTTMTDQLCIYGEKNISKSCSYKGPDGKTFQYWTARNARTKKWYYADENNNPKGWYLSGSQPEGCKRMRFYDEHVFSKITSRGSDVILLFAQYGYDNDYQITLDACGGTVETPDFSVAPGSSYGELPIPTRPGYAFLGWFTKSEGGVQEISRDIPKADSTLYAHWVPRAQRIVTGSYTEWTSDSIKPQYICALSKLLVQMGQQDDVSFDPARCYVFLENTDMIGTSNGEPIVRTGKYTENGFLEYYAPELTFYGISDSGDYPDEAAYTDELSSLYECGMGILVKLYSNKEKTKLCWRTVTRVENGEVYILDEREEVPASEHYYGIDYAHIFQFHGIWEAGDIPRYIPGEYTVGELDDILQCTGSVSLSSAMADETAILAEGKTYHLIAAGYDGHGQMLWVQTETFTADSENMELFFASPTEESQTDCRAFILQEDYSPVLWNVILERS